MLYLIAGILLLGILTALFSYFANRNRKNKATSASTEATPVADSDCCGQHEVCERDSLLAAVSQKIEYYDDEELDTYRETPSGEYSDHAIDEFREVLYTLRETEVAGWLRSLQLRGINLPDPLKDEALLIVEERRVNNH
ncbi:phospholipase [Bacteroides sp. OttesenSCG-928-D19]|nr:phospholipase [Bacteroides sp. OttesenSCG-928-D19]